MDIEPNKKNLSLLQTYFREFVLLSLAVCCGYLFREQKQLNTYIRDTLTKTIENNNQTLLMFKANNK